MNLGTSHVALVSGKDPPINDGNVRETESIPSSGKSPGGRKGKPLQHA